MWNSNDVKSIHFSMKDYRFRICCNSHRNKETSCNKILSDHCEDNGFSYENKFFNIHKNVRVHDILSREAPSFISFRNDVKKPSVGKNELSTVKAQELRVL